MSSLRIRAGVASAALLAIGGFALALPASLTAGGSQTYTDPTGDNIGQGADITTVKVSNNDAGLITLRVDTPNHPRLEVTENIVVYLDTDNNRNTGTVGYEYRLFVFGGNVPPIGLDRWTGSGWEDATAQSGLKGTFDKGLTATFTKTAIGVTSSFAFSAISADSRAKATSDRAPNGATDERWSYQVKIGGGSRSRTSTTRTAPRKRHISPRFPTPNLSSQGITTFTSFVISRLPRGARVVMRYGRLTERLTASASGRASSRLFVRGFRAGSIIRVRVTKGGYVPYSARLRVLIRPPWLTVTPGG